MKRIIACFIAAALIMSSSAMAISADSTLVPRDVSMICSKAFVNVSTMKSASNFDAALKIT